MRGPWGFGNGDMDAIKTMTDLIIFDCDGTLVDSEVLYNTVISDLLKEAGLDTYTPQVCLALFTGLTFSNIRELMETKHDLDLSEVMSAERYIAKSQARMDEKLDAIEGARDLLESVSASHKICIGSNGERSSVIKSLQNTGLYDFFGGNDDHIFTKIQVKNPKPAPDLFLYAAHEMGIAPEHCWVMEDSVAGVQAGPGFRQGQAHVFGEILHQRVEVQQRVAEAAQGQ